MYINLLRPKNKNKVKGKSVTTNIEEDGGKSPAKKTVPKTAGGRFAPRRKRTSHLTPGEKAEAVALWRSGDTTLDELGKRFQKRPETMQRLFKEMGISKGEAAKEHQAKVTAEVEARLLSDVGLQAQRIIKMKEEHFKMADSIAKLVWQEIVEAKKNNRKLETLRATMQTLQIASNTLANVRSELYTILRVEHQEKEDDDDALPELLVRELTSSEVESIRNADAPPEDDLDLPEIDLPGAPGLESNQ